VQIGTEKHKTFQKQDNVTPPKVHSSVISESKDFEKVEMPNNSKV
jgi:hypothetical protein